MTTHGVAGELRLYPYADSPAFLAGFDTFYLDEEGREALRASAVRVHKNICLVKLAGVDSIADARPMIGRRVYIARNDAKLPEGRFFVQDMLGARVVNAATGEEYGRITAITRPGRHDVYEIEGAGGEVYLFPAAGPFVEKLSVEEGLVLVKPIAGMFEKPDGLQKEGGPGAGGGP